MILLSKKTVWDSLNFDPNHDTVDVDKVVRPFASSRMLYTKVTGSGVAYNHSATVRDNETPIGGDGKPIFQSVWEYMLGINKGAQIDELKDINIPYPNPTDVYVTIPNLKEYQVMVYSISGAEMPFEIVKTGLNISNLPDGIYLLNLSSDSGSKTYRIIKR